MKSVSVLVLCLVVSFAAALPGALFPPGEWYAGLDRPDWNPPDWVFPPVWSLLYIFMGVSAWLVWRKLGFARAWPALAIFLVQLTLNAAWSWIFFGLHLPAAAFLEIVVLWFAILLTVVTFWRASRAAGLLLLPYLAWVSFAAVLNWKLWRLNP